MDVLQNLPRLPQGPTNRQVKKPPIPLVDLGIELTIGEKTRKRENLAELDWALPPSAPLLTNVLTYTLSEQSTWVKTPRRLIGFGILPSTLTGKLIECVKLPASDEEAVKSVRTFFESLGKEATFVGDAPGLVLPRIRCMLLNEACFALAERVAAPRDIDLAMRLGTNYPTGPFEWGEKVGLQNVLAILEALRDYYGEERYRPAPLLRKSAMAGKVPVE